MKNKQKLLITNTRIIFASKRMTYLYLEEDFDITIYFQNYDEETDSSEIIRSVPIEKVVGI